MRPGHAAGSCAPARTSSGTRPRACWPRPRARRRGRAGHRRGRRRFYAPKLELHREGRHRPRVDRAARCSSTIVLPERLDAEYIGRGRLQAAAGHAAPGDPGLVRALHRHPDRELRRGASRCGWRPTQVVVATITSDADDYRARRRRSLTGRRACGPRSTSAMRRSTTRSANTASPRCR